MTTTGAPNPTTGADGSTTGAQKLREALQQALTALENVITQVKYDEECAAAIIAARQALATTEQAAPAVPPTVYLVENRTCLLAYASREDADKAVASMPASVGGGFLVSPVQVFGATSPAPAVPQVAIQVIDAKIASVRAANIGRGGLINSAVSFAIGLLEDVREAIAANEAKAAPAVPQGEPVAYLWKYIGKDPYPAQIHGKTDGYIARSIKEMNPENPPYPDTWKPETPLYPPASLPAAPPAPAVPRDEMVSMVDAAMVEMLNISPPLRRSECERLICAAINDARARRR